MQRLLIIAFVFVAFAAKAQSDYPFAILPGAGQTVASATDTLWVLKHSQMQNAIAAARENKLLKEQVATLTEKIGLGGQRTVASDSLTSLYRDQAEHYEKQWRECDADLQIVAKQYRKQRMLTYTASAGIVVAVLLGLFVF